MSSENILAFFSFSISFFISYFIKKHLVVSVCLMSIFRKTILFFFEKGEVGGSNAGRKQTVFAGKRVSFKDNVLILYENSHLKF